MMRSHGADAPREIYQFGKKGDKVYDAIEKYINLRYKFLPYIYSTSWHVTANKSSMMRALMMDFPTDKNALDINDQFMFGKSLLISPVTEPMYVRASVNGRDTIQVEDFSKIKSRETYLPVGTGWFDFWTGERLPGGIKTMKETDIDILPLYVKSGAIIVMAPAVQYVDEKKWDELEVRVYPGANGTFVLYDDEHDNYNYEKGVYATTTFDWNDSKRLLIIAERKGSFPGMPRKQKFKITVVSKTKGGGDKQIDQPDKVITYEGKRVSVKL
jgi:alpha-D-xyloside xylohydrolase